MLPEGTYRSKILSTGISKVFGSIFTDYARSFTISVLRSGIKQGALIIKDKNGTQHFGNSESGDSKAVVLTVLNEDLWTRIFLSYDLGLSEAYMEGDFEVSSLKGLLDLWLINRAYLTGGESTLSSLLAQYSALAINYLGRQNFRMSLKNVEVAYDISNDFYQCFLSKEMMYSCAIWGHEENGPQGDLTVGRSDGDLETAQLRKIHNILGKARLRPGNQLLEIGTGWGAMAIEAAKLGCIVESVTLSVEQKDFAERRAHELGVSERITIHLCDYRQLPASFKHRFDALVSCEMFEAVGIRQWPLFFRTMDWALKPDKAAAVITATAQPEFRYSEYQRDDFARHYHWPNCFLPSATALPSELQRTIPGKFVLYNLEDHGIHYCRTLREWGRRLNDNFCGHIVRQMKEKHPKLREEKEMKAFVRKWTYMFAYAEAGYDRAYTSLNCWTFARPENAFYPCD